ncbi:MAG TPA: TlpA disulfide reductase family protein [Acidimicrobiales bacterium]|nr:TlpA disulfide reductase family protein [Acidimicrobiales bacterium]
MDVTEAVDRPPRRLALVSAVVVAVVLVAFIVLLATRDPATDRQSESPLIGQVAPALTGDTITEAGGGSYDLDLQRGQWVVVNFFATWCTPCITEHPELVEFSERHAAVGDAAVVSVVFDDRASNVTDFFDENGGEWPVVDGGEVILDWAVAQVPESFLVDPDGVVVARITGGVTADGLDDLLGELQGA